jgi:hypothetical protein
MTAKDEFIASLDGLYLDHFRLHAKLRDTAGAFRFWNRRGVGLLQMRCGAVDPDYDR